MTTATILNRAATGWLKGYPIRTARKAGKCAGFRFCGTIIQPGDLYVDCDPYKAGGFGHDRHCLACAQVEPTALPEATKMAGGA